MVHWNVNYEGEKFCCLKAEGDYVWYKSDELDANYVMLIMGKEVCTDVCNNLMCKYTCVLDLVNMG